VRLLGLSSEAERARDFLRALHPAVAGPLRAECVSALARIDRGDPLVLESLNDTHPEVVAASVRALASEPRKKPRPEVLAVLSDEARGADVLPELVTYCSLPGQDIGEETVLSFLRYAARADLPVATRILVLEGVPRFGLGITSRLRREFDGLVASSESALRDAALVALTLLKDGKSRRELLKPFDEQVQTNENWPLAYQRRGDVLYKIGEYKEAARDYQEAIRLHEDSAKLPGNRELWINLARAFVKDNKLKPAADALEEFGLSSDLRKTLREDPDFQPLVEHARFRELFE
jgi:tetratricopeptide (TPR) repeat protein